ncbi:MAG: PIN domain nuclease [Deltaproteobacteria bacterium]|nr:PIN domain nuclease [Deltaproteobacteria bacterium]
MRTADRTYVDPRALRRLYVHDDLSRAFCAWRARLGGALPITLHGRAELVNSIALAVFRHDITDEAGSGALADLAADLAEGRLHLAPLPWRRAWDDAAELSRTHTPKLGTRTLDVLHVSSALVLGCRAFVTYDGRQTALAEAVGLKVVRP